MRAHAPFRRMSTNFAAALALAACSKAPAPTIAPPPSDTARVGTDAGSETGAQAVRPDEHGMPEPVSIPAIKAICAKAACAGPLSRVEVWRSDTGRVGVFAHFGDIGLCSHPPLIYFDRNGAELGGIPEQPVVKGSDEEREFTARREKMTAGLRRVETMHCRDAK